MNLYKYYTNIILEGSICFHSLVFQFKKNVTLNWYTFTSHNFLQFDGQIKEDRMGGACRIH
jgi:hypothetical protein